MNELGSAEAVVGSGSLPLRTLDRLLRGQLISRLSKIQHGRLVLEDCAGQVVLGSGHGALPEARVEVLDPAFYRTVAGNGSVGAAQAYMDGQWRCDDLVSLIRLLVRNRALLDGLEGGGARLGGWLLRAWHALRRNTLAGAAQNIAAHYDLGNDFFALFLSADLMYSAAMWEVAGDTLEAASARKLQRICERLDLNSADHLCEIGSGWGGFALYAAEHYGCRVTTVTLSQQQFAWVTRQIQDRGLSDRITVLLRDYRELDGQYDKVASIEMIEAVGAGYLETYMARVAALLKPGGRALLQAITIEDHRYAQAVASVDFIKRHIFPGSFIPSIHAIVTAKMRVSDLSLIQLEDFGSSYARTLREWRRRFLARLPEVRGLGFDDRFIRMWEYYLAYCEGGFLERSIGVAHLVFERPQSR
jgi:cyclopropane-fatty-acyl-phospholipid synthase